VHEPKRKRWELFQVVKGKGGNKKSVFKKKGREGGERVGVKKFP